MPPRDTAPLALGLPLRTTLHDWCMASREWARPRGAAKRKRAFAPGCFLPSRRPPVAAADALDALVSASKPNPKKKLSLLPSSSLPPPKKKQHRPAPRPGPLPVGLAPPRPPRPGQLAAHRRLPRRARRDAAGQGPLRPGAGQGRLRRRLRRRTVARADARVRRRRARDARAHDAPGRVWLRVQHGRRRRVPGRDPPGLLPARRRREQGSARLRGAPRRGGLRHRDVLPPHGRGPAQDGQGRGRQGREGAGARGVGLEASADRRRLARRQRQVDRAEGRAVLLREVGEARDVLPRPGGAVLYPAQAHRVRAVGQGGRG